MSASQDLRLGRRIVVWGATGSGKTTAARRLSHHLCLPHVELDAIRHRGAWDAVEFPEMRDSLRQRLAACPDGWVIDGGYSPVHDLYLPHADTLVWLHLPWRVSFWRLFKRTVTRAWTREPVYDEEGPRESLRMTFLTRRSILLWSISNHRRNVRTARQGIAGLAPGVAVRELRSAEEVSRFLREATRAREGPQTPHH
jgi:adenylate kinase family enzyme